MSIEKSGTEERLLVSKTGPQQSGWRALLLRLAPADFRHRAAIFAGPLLLFLGGLVLATVAAPGPLPGWPVVASFAFAFLSYLLAARLAYAGKGALIAALIVLVGLALLPLAFGPSPQDNRKVTEYNAWVYDLGSHLPAIVAPPPNPNGVSVLLAAGLAFCGAAALLGARRRRAAFMVAAILAAALLLTASRAGWLAGAAALLFLARGRRQRLAWVGAALAGLILLIAPLALATPPPGQPGVLSTESTAMRIEQWGHTIELLAAHPLTGLGPGRFAAAYAEAASAANRPFYKSPDDTPLQVWADAGLLGLLACAWAAVIVWRSARRSSSPNWLRDGLLAALLAFAIHSIFETDTAITWVSHGGYGYLASPLPFAMLGMLAGILTADDV